MASYEIESIVQSSNPNYKYIAGVDESGLGSMVGDVYVAGVIFAPDFDFSLLPGLDDSKKKTPAQREELYNLIKNYAYNWAVEVATLEEIEQYNVYWARFMAAFRVVNALKPDFVLMDGNHDIPDIKVPQMAVVKGDGKSYSIAAASILAKVDRDRYITSLAEKVHPDYGWAKNKAYGTKQHTEAIKKHGATKWHRTVFVRKYT